jgi:hypothetical protein
MRKLEGGVQKGETKNKTHLVSWKFIFLLAIIFITPFPLHFKDDL